MGRSSSCITLTLAFVASVSNQDIARKLEREQKKKKKKKMEGGRAGEGRRGNAVSFSPLLLSRHSLLFALVPTFSTNSRGNTCHVATLTFEAF